MTHRYIKMGATVTVLTLAFAGLLWSTLREGTEYFKNIDEVVSTQGAWEGKQLQLHGYVVPGSILRKRDSLEYKFKVQNKGSVVDAAYRGVVPDTFKSDSEVVLKGVLTADGFTTQPNGVMAKCPSKYEAKSGGATAPSGTY